ncbi:uncharacterized protein LOC126841844 isoform X3 [Adelges cooleyi]|uniref:uncharacterized protein LOC126841844 isoform X3 n=1 Tax=Adelges cooleyi TaxID=133065 RepID=UPI00218086D4|nr:uncharacterized protein LOC126841844 isoform X3 [Adelges cooleyi]
MQSIMQSILLFLLFLFFQVIRSQNYGTQQSVNDPYKTNTGIFNFNNILRNGLATGVSTVETGSNILQQPLRAATNQFQYAPEGAANIQPGQYNENPYNSSPYNENLNPNQQGMNALKAGASIQQLPLYAATNQFQYAPEGAANIQPGQYNENPYNSSPYNEHLNPNQQGMNALEAGASIQQLPLQAATNQFQYAPEGAANIQPGQYNENPYNSSPYNEHLNPNQQGMNALEAGASIQQLPLHAATNQFQYAPKGAANLQPGRYNENPYNSSPYNENLNPIQQGINTATSNFNNILRNGLATGVSTVETGSNILQQPLRAATNQFQYAPEGAANIQPGQYNENPYYNSSPYNENLNPIQKGINTATSNFNNIMGAGLTTGVTALGGGADILGQQLNGATNLVQNIPKFTSNGIDFLQNIGQTGTDMTNNVLKLSTAPIVAKLNKFGNVLNGFSSYSDPQNQIDQSNNIQVPSMNYEHRY